MKRVLFTVGWLSITLSSYAQPFDYLPASVGNNQILHYIQYTISYNEQHEQPDWVAYELTGTEATMDQDRCECFASDFRITSQSASASDYRSTGFDRGHLSPAADNNLSEESNRESFLFSNMTPQLPGFNRGIWAELENWVRNKAIEFDTVYVVTGPVFLNSLGRLGNNEVTIPGYYYKVLLRFENGSPRTIAFLMPHASATGNIEDYVVTVNTIETLTGLDLFPALSNSVENRVEAQYFKSQWGLN